MAKRKPTQPALNAALPADLAAERATLGSVFLDRDSIGLIEPWLEPDHFSDQRHAQIYEAMIACFRRRVPPDIVAVSSELRSRDRLDPESGLAYLVELSNATPTATHIHYYAGIVERTAVLRRLIQAGGQIAQLGYTSGEDIDAILSDAEKALASVQQKRQTEGYQDLATIASAFYDNLIALREGGKEMIGVPSGFRDLDELTGGWQKSDLIILAARPAVGKSSFALSVALNAAERQHRPAFEALEMSREQLVQRALAVRTGVDTQKLRNGQIHESDLQLITDELGYLYSLPLAIDDVGGLSLSALRSKALRLQATSGLDLLIIDYLQLMREPKSESRFEEVSSIARGLKNLAMELDVPILALSQLSRAVEGRTSHVPMLSDLRESGEIEQAADLVMFIYREELYEPETDKKGIAEIHIAKHRNGPTGIVPLRFFNNTTKFADLERYRAPEGF